MQTAESSLQNGILFLSNTFKKLGSYVYITNFFKVDLPTEPEKFKKFVFKTEQELQKKVSELQDVLPEFGSHLISVQWGKINKILRWTFLLYSAKAKSVHAFF